MNQQYFRFEPELKASRLTINRGSIGNWEYEIYTNFQNQSVMGWRFNAGMSANILFDKKALHPLELPWLWVQALEEVDSAMCRHWQSRHC